MMNDKQIISKLQSLKQIKPNQDWASSLKRNIVGEEPSFGTQFLTGFDSMFSMKKMAYASLSVLVILMGTIGFAQYTVPGDLLFSVKKMSEQSQGALLSSVSQSDYNLDTVNKRLGELAIIIKDNKTGNIEPAVQEVRDGINQVVKNMSSDANNFTDIATKIQRIQQTKRDVETLGVIMLEESNQLNNALAPLIENEIKVLDQSTNLSIEQQMDLVVIKSHYKKGEYTAALEKILLITNSK